MKDKILVSETKHENDIPSQENWEIKTFFEITKQARYTKKEIL